jgi:hypothetical protein
LREASNKTRTSIKCILTHSSSEFFEPAEFLQQALCVARFSSWIGERWQEGNTVYHGMRPKTKGSPKDRSPAAGGLLSVASNCQAAHKGFVMCSAYGSGSAPKVLGTARGIGRAVLLKSRDS